MRKHEPANLYVCVTPWCVACCRKKLLGYSGNGEFRSGDPGGVVSFHGGDNNIDLGPALNLEQQQPAPEVSSLCRFELPRCAVVYDVVTMRFFDAKVR